MAMEIERKWLLSFEQAIEFVAKENCKTERISQFYTVVENDREVRYREVWSGDVMATNSKFYRTEKTGSGLSRVENEIEIPRCEINDEHQHKVGNHIDKVRVHCAGLEIDFYTSPDLVGMVTAEKEFETIDEANAYHPPAGLCTLDVTDDKRFKNKSLALHGRPVV